MLSPKIFAALALALTFASTAPTQAGWDAWQWMPILEKAHQQHSTITPAPSYRAFARADWSQYRTLRRPGKRSGRW